MPTPAVRAALDRPFVFVTGKGGTGKSTVARVLAANVAPGRVRETEAVDPDAALEEWLARHVGSAAAALLRRSHTFAYLVAAAPGVAELVTIGKLADEARRGRVVVAGPSTGHALAMLAAPRTFAGLEIAGRVGTEAGELRSRLEDPAFAAYVGVALAEPMAVAELIQLAERLPATIGRGLDLVVVNALHPDRFSDADAERLQAAARRGPGRGLLEAVLVEHRRARRERERVDEIREHVAAPVIALPFVYPPASDVALVECLAASIRWEPDGAHRDAPLLAHPARATELFGDHPRPVAVDDGDAVADLEPEVAVRGEEPWDPQVPRRRDDEDAPHVAEREHERQRA
jgi:anion-transporting  ArsA/GET3 family ATPase